MGMNEIYSLIISGLLFFSVAIDTVDVLSDSFHSLLRRWKYNNVR